MEKRICENCKKEFYVKLCVVKHNGGKYCSQKCHYEKMIGHPKWGGHQFNKGHIVTKQTRYKQSESRSGKKHYRWKGGKRKTVQGYILIYKPEHPNCNRDGRIFEHRFVMEEHLKRYLAPFEIVHHKNNIKDDNKLENLLLTIQGKNWHSKFCPKCGFELGIE